MPRVVVLRDGKPCATDAGIAELTARVDQLEAGFVDCCNQDQNVPAGACARDAFGQPIPTT